MTLPSSGIITAAMINTELLRSSTAPFDINESEVRRLAGKLSGTISFSDFYGKTYEIIVTISSSVNNISMRNYFTATQWSSSAVKRLVIGSGVIIGSTSPSSPALRTGSGNGGTLIVENHGSLRGAGGVPNGGTGGTAFLADAEASLINYGTIYSGGGAGGRGGTGGPGVYYTTTTEGPYESGTTYRWIDYVYTSDDDDEAGDL